MNRLTMFTGVAIMLAIIPVRSVSAAHAMESAVTEAGKDSIITVRGDIGLLNGEAHEIVYGGKDAPGQEDYKVSELIWDLKSVTMAGAVVSIGGDGRLVLNAGLWAGVNQGLDGEMYDYDWMDSSRSDWTDRSRSEVDLTSALMFDINLSLEVFQGEGYSLGGVAGLMFDSWEWEDRGQEYTYSVNGFRDTQGTFGGQNVINYKQSYLIPYIGVEGAMDLGRFSLQGWILYSSVVAAEDEDHHILRSLQFKETFEGGEYIAYGISATLDISETLFIQGSVERQEVKEIVGDLEIVNTGSTNTDGAGISHESTMLSAAVGIRL